MLVVGATGVLRPAVLSCLDRGWAVTAVARTLADLSSLAAEAGPGIRPVPLDVYDAQVVTAALPPFDDALIYLAAADDDAENLAAERLQSQVTGTTVRILTSRWTPGGEPLSAGRWPTVERRVHLLLGEHRDQKNDVVRWHTPSEISAAALLVLDSRTDSILGTPVTPHDS